MRELGCRAVFYSKKREECYGNKDAEKWLRVRKIEKKI